MTSSRDLLAHARPFAAWTSTALLRRGLPVDRVVAHRATSDRRCGRGVDSPSRTAPVGRASEVGAGPGLVVRAESHGQTGQAGTHLAPSIPLRCGPPRPNRGAPRRDAAGRMFAGLRNVGRQRCESGRQQNVREPPEPVGANEELRRLPFHPAGTRVAIGSQELAISLDRFDTCLLALCREPRAQGAAGLPARRARAPRLAQDRPPTEDASTGLHSLGGHGSFDRGDLRA